VRSFFLAFYIKKTSNNGKLLIIITMSAYGIALACTWIMFLYYKRQQKNENNSLMKANSGDNPLKNTPASLLCEFCAWKCPDKWEDGYHAGYYAIMLFSVVTGALFPQIEMYMSSRWFEIQPLANANALVVIASSVCEALATCFASRVIVKRFGRFGHFCLMFSLLVIGFVNCCLGSVTNIYCSYGLYLIFMMFKRICRFAPQQYVSSGLKKENTQKYTAVTISKFTSLGMMIGFIITWVINRFFAKVDSEKHPLSMMYHIYGFFCFGAFLLLAILLFLYRKPLREFMKRLTDKQEAAKDENPGVV
jgi:hypothetical protein